MENFFYNENFFSDLTECCEYNDMDEDEINSYPNDFKLEVQCSILQPIVQLSPEWIASRITEDRFSEEKGDSEFSSIIKVLEENIDFEKINSLMPKLYYPNSQKHYFTKQDLLEAVS